MEKGQDAFLVGGWNCEAEKEPGAGDSDICHAQRLGDIGTRDRAIQPGGQGAVRDRAGGDEQQDRLGLVALDLMDGAQPRAGTSGG